MPLRQRNLVTAALAYFMAWCIVASPAVPILIFSPAGLALVGPRYFGYDIDYLPVEERFGAAVRA